jgi:hypothetical protein
LAFLLFDFLLLRIHTPAPVESDELIQIIDGSVGDLREKIGMLRIAVDELREVLNWITKNPDATFELNERVRTVVCLPPERTSDDCRAAVDEVRP